MSEVEQDHRALEAAPTLAEIARTTAASMAVAAAGRCERVMVCAVRPDGGMDCIAEVRRASAPGFLGLHLPAAALPDSPHHFAFRLMAGERPWGLLVCHLDPAHPEDPDLRERLAGLAADAGCALDDVIRSHRDEAVRRNARRLAAIGYAVQRADNLVRHLLSADPGLLDLADADGIAVVADGAIAGSGLTPDAAAIRRLAALSAASPEGWLALESLESLSTADSAAGREAVAGVLAVALTRDPCVVLAAFRREEIREEIWGDLASATGSWVPQRRSVAGHCRPWTPEAVAGWRALPATLSQAIGSLGAATLRLIEDLPPLLPAGRSDGPLLSALLDVAVPTLLVASHGPGNHPTVEAANRAFRRFFGLPADALTGQPLDHALRTIALSDPLIPAQALTTGVEATVTPPGRGERTVRIRERPLQRFSCRDRDHALAAWLFEDVTAARRTEQALLSARDQTAAASRDKSAFLARMSHELRTPLNTIIGFSEIMRAELFGALGSPKYLEYVRNIQTSGEHLLAVLRRVVNSSQLEAEHAVLEEQTLDLSAILEDVCAEESGRATQAGVALMLDVATREMPVLADANALRQIVRTLLSNAFQFTPAGGAVTCRTLCLSSGGTAIEVHDTGVGLSPEHLQRLCDSFTPARKSATGGQGLSLVRILTELHGGRFTVSSPPGRGTTIRLNLPPWRTVLAEDGVAAGDIVPKRM